jgi:ribosome biogenesis GTPase
LSPLRGLIVRSQSGFYTVEIEGGQEVLCKLRGRLKQGAREGDLVAIGDWVKVTILDEQRGMIEEIESRQRIIARMAPSPGGEYQQIIIANPDQAIFVFACAEPKPRLRMLDRFLVIAEKQEVPAIIIANKIDLVGLKKAKSIFDHYQSIGYPIIYTSAITGQGVASLQQYLVGLVSVMTGPSGVGKSSLLNCIQPGLGLEVKRVSQATGKGKHATVLSAMFKLPEGGYVADTPGIKALAFWDIEPEELDGFFPEIKPLVKDCQYNDCTHLHEPGCAVKRGVETGLVHPERYLSYTRLRMGDED